MHLWFKQFAATYCHYFLGQFSAQTILFANQAVLENKFTNLHYQHKAHQQARLIHLCKAALTICYK